MSSADVSSNVLHSHKDKLINVLVSGQYVNQIIPSKNINDLPVIKPIFLWYDKKLQSLVWEPKNLNQQRQITKECNIVVSNIKDCVVSQPIHNLDENLKSLCVTIVYTNNISDTNNLLQSTFQCNDTTQIKIIILALRLILLDNKSSSSEQTVPSNDTKTTESTSTSSSSSSAAAAAAAAPATVTTKTSTEPLSLSLPEPDTRQLKNQFPMLKTVLNKLQPKKIIRALADYLSAGYTINNPLIDALITIEIEPIFTYFYNSGLPIIRFIPNSATFEQTTLYFYPDDARGVLYWGSFRSPQGVIRLHEVTEITSGKSSSSSLNLDKYNEILSGYELTKRLALTTVTVPINGIVEKEKIITSTFYIIDASFPLLQLFILMITRLLCDPQTSQKMRVIYGKQSIKSSSTTTPTSSSSSTATSSSTTAKSKTKNVATQSTSNYVDNLPTRFHDIQPLKNSSTYQSLPDHMGWLLDSFASLSLNEQPSSSSSSSSSEITDDALSSSSASLSIAIPSSQFQSSLMFSPAKKTRSKIFQDDEPSKQQQQQQQHQLQQQQQQQQPVVTADDEANHQSSIISTDTLPVSIMSADISELLTNPAIITALDDLHRTAQNQRKLHYNTLQQRHTIAGVSSYPSSSSTSTAAAAAGTSSSIALASAAETEFIAKPNDKTHTAIPTTTLHGPSPVRQKINSATTQSFQTLNKSSQSANEMSQEKQKMIDQQLYIEQLQHQLLVSSQQLEEHRQKELDIQEKNKKCLDEIFQKIETPQKEQKKATKLMSELHSSIQKAQSQYNTLHEQFADGLAPFDLSDSEEESEESDSSVHDSKNKVIPNAFQLNRVHRSGDSGDVADDDDDDDCLILDDSLMTDNDNDNQTSNNDISNDNHIQNAMIGLGSSQQVSSSSPSGIQLQNNSLNNSKRISKAQTRRLVENSMRGLDKSSVASLEQYLDKSTRDSLSMFHSSQNNSNNNNNNNNNANNGNDDVNTHKSHHEMLQLRNPKLRQKLTTATYNRQDKTKINQPSKATSPVLSTASAGSSTTTRKPSDINALPTYKQTGLVDISGVLHEEPKYQKTQLPTTRQKRVSYPISHNELNTSFFSTNGSTSSSTNSLATKPLVNKKPTAAVKPPISHNNPINRPNKPSVGGAHGSTTQQTTAAVVTGTKIANNTTTITPSTTTSSSTQISPPTASASSQPSTKLTANRSASNTAVNSKSSIGAAPIATSTKVPSSRSQIGSATATSTATRTLPRSGVASKSSINEPIKPKSTTSATSSATASRIGAARSGVNNGGIPRRNPSSSTTTSSSSSTAARK